MKLKIIIIASLVVLVAGGGAYYWHHTHQNERRTTNDERRLLYHCPMHPTYTSDRPGSCPICGMDLVLVEEEKQGAGSGERGVTDRADITISQERQQLIGVKTAVIAKIHAIKEIRTVASTTFNPELAVAQAEYLEAKKIGEASLINAATQRLTLLGMNTVEIGGLKEVQAGRILPNNEMWIYPIVYEYELPFIATGQEVDVAFANGKSYKGIVRSIDSVIDPATRSARLHVKIDGANGEININQFGTAKIKVDLGEKLIIPKSGIIGAGDRNIAIMVHDGTHFMPMDVQLGPELEDSYVIDSGLNEGDTVVSSATFLIDSESQLKAAIGTVGGEHKH